MARESLATRLYRGEVSGDFIGRRRIWYAMSATVMLIGIVSLLVRGLNPSIDFKGGAEFQGPLNGHSLSTVTDAITSAGITSVVPQTTGSGSDARFQVETPTIPELGPTGSVTAVETKLSTDLGISRNSIDITTVGSTWGSQITSKAIKGLVIFLIAVIIYLSVRFEWKMALAAIIALIHDLVITAGIYSLSGLQVSPSTVIALLTILGYSLYDTVVVFDKVRENTAGIAGGSKMTFTQAANLAVNQTLVRSINTSVIALLPVLGLLVIGAGLLGAGSLDDLSVALFIGLASGAYSSIFIATPLLCDFKERESTYQQLAKRVASRRIKEAREAAGGTLEPATATAGVSTGVTAAQLAGSGSAARLTDTDRTSIADLGEQEPDDRPPVEARTGPPPRTGSRPSQPRRNSPRRGRPSGRGGKSRKRR
jgi:preprotein translocase subunit SecF